MASPIKDGGKETNMDVDYVISYNFGETGQSEAISQLQTLIETLSSVGLETEVRNGDNQGVLIFTKLASKQNLYGEIYRQRIKDWLHGVRSSAPEKEMDTSEEKEQLLPAERLRIVHNLIVSPKEEGGAGITPKHGQWENVQSVFALHDHAFNKHWIKKWATSYTLKSEDLDQIRDQFGEKVAFYFAFTQSYFMALIAIASFGASAYFLMGYFSPVYAVINSLFCICFVEYWKSQEFDLAVRWNVQGVSSIETKRHDFAAEKEIEDPVTGEKVRLFPGTKRLQRQALQLPFALLAALALGALIATCFAIEIFITEVYNGPGQSVLVFLPTGILTTVQPLLLGFLTNIAEKLNGFENYETDSAYDTALTQKVFVLNFITSYLPIFLTAFVYVPFASNIVPYLDVFSLAVRPMTGDSEKIKAPSGGSFHINPSRLRKQVIYFTVTAQIVNQALEVLVPYIQRRGMNKFKEIQKKRSDSKTSTASTSDFSADQPEEASFLKRVRHEAELGQYDVTTDLREMVIQYGYLALFSVVFPPTGVSFLINNWIELRTDAIKICVETQRPVPWRADSIGPWLDSLSFLTWLGSISTAAIVYMFYDAGSGTGDVAPGPEGLVAHIKPWALLFSIFASEHLFFLARWGVKHAVSRLDSPGRRKQRAERYIVRKKYLDENMGEQAQKMAAKMDAGDEKITRQSLEEEVRGDTLKRGANNVEERFWRRQRGWKESALIGKGLIEKGFAEKNKEGKKTQ